MPNEVASVLGRMSALRTVGQDTLNRLAGGAFLQEFPVDIIIHPQNVRPDFLHVLVAGGVELIRDEGEVQATVSMVTADSLFGLADVVADSPTFASAVTLAPSIIAFIPAQRVHEALAADPRFGLAILRCLASDARGLGQDLAEMKALTAGQRLGRWVLRERSRTGLSRFPIPYTKRVLATLLGMSPENLSRSATGLSAQGARFSGRTVEVTDPITLDRYARWQAADPAVGFGMIDPMGQASSGS